MVIEAFSKIDFSQKKICVSCSGGLDSTVLLHAILSLGIKPHVIHINYQLRGEASDLDEESVRKIITDFDLEHTIVKCPKVVVKGSGINLQAAARDFRRKYYTEWTDQSANHLLLLGQHADDQVETFFLQHFRGAGLFGLGGMHFERKQILRPFLDLRKNDLLEYARNNQLSWREDESNAHNDYLRNTFRNKLIPALEIEIPSLRESILFLQEKFRDKQAELAEMISQRLAHWKYEGEIAYSEWNSLESSEQIALCMAFDWPLWTIQRIQELESAPLSSKINRSSLFRTKTGFAWSENLPAKYTWEFKHSKDTHLPNRFDLATIYIEESKAIELRSVRINPEDYFQRLGMKSKVKISKILKDNGIPLQWRNQFIGLEDNKGLVWIPNIALRSDFLSINDGSPLTKITLSTKK